MWKVLLPKKYRPFVGAIIEFAEFLIRAYNTGDAKAEITGIGTVNGRRLGVKVETFTY